MLKQQRMGSMSTTLNQLWLELIRRSELQRDLEPEQGLYMALYSNKRFVADLPDVTKWAGTSRVPTVKVQSRLTRTLCFLRRWQESFGLFEAAQRCRSLVDVVLADTLIDALKDKWPKALRFLCDVRRSALELDSNSYQPLALGMLDSNSSQDVCRWAQVVQLLRDVQSRSVEAVPALWTAGMLACHREELWELSLQLLCMARRFGAGEVTRRFNVAIPQTNWDASVQLFDGIAQCGAVPDECTFCRVIDACARRQLWQSAVEKLLSMSLWGVPPTLRTFSAALMACATSGRLDVALRLRELMWSHAIMADRFVYGLLLSACERAEQWEMACHILSEMRTTLDQALDLVAYTTAIRACARAEQWEAARRLFWEMRSYKLQIDAVGYNCAIASVRTGPPELSVGLLEDMRQARLEPSAASLRSAISACRRSRAWERAMHLISEASSARVVCDTVLPGAATSSRRHPSVAFEAHQRWDLSVELLQELRHTNVELTMIVCAHAIAACMRGRKWVASSWHFSAMRGAAVEPDTVVANSVITSCERCMQWERALLMPMEMRSRAISCDIVSCCAVLGACENGGHWRCTAGLLEEMRSRGPEPGIFAMDSVLSAVGKGEEWAKAVQLLQVMRNGGADPALAGFHAGVSACRRGQCWWQSAQLLRDMRARRVGADAPTLVMAAGAQQELAPALATDVRGLVADMLRKLRAPRAGVRHASGATETAARSVQAVEMLDAHHMLDGFVEHAFRSSIYAPVLGRLSGLSGRVHRQDSRAATSQLHDRYLERQPTLGRAFTAAALEMLQMLPQRLRKKRLPKHIRRRRRRLGLAVHNACGRWLLPWPMRSRLELRRAGLSMGIGADADPPHGPSSLADPVAKAITSCLSFRVALADRSELESRGQAFGSTQNLDATYLKAVVVVHDRAAHAERSALVTLFQRLEPYQGQASGTVRLFASHTLCISCLAACCQFKRLLPQLQLQISFDTWQESRRWSGTFE